MTFLPVAADSMIASSAATVAGLRGHHHTSFLIPDLRTALQVTRDEVTTDG